MSIHAFGSWGAVVIFVSSLFNSEDIHLFCIILKISSILRICEFTAEH